MVPTSRPQRVKTRWSDPGCDGHPRFQTPFAEMFAHWRRRHRHHLETALFPNLPRIRQGFWTCWNHPGPPPTLTLLPLPSSRLLCRVQEYGQSSHRSDCLLLVLWTDRPLLLSVQGEGGRSQWSAVGGLVIEVWSLGNSHCHLVPTRTETSLG